MPEDTTEQLYAEALELVGYNAMTLQAMCLWAQQHAKEKTAMKAASAAWGRNARLFARATNFFPELTYTPTKLSQDEILSLVCLASLKENDAKLAYLDMRASTLTYWQVRERVAAVRADANGKRERAPSLAERCAALALQWWDIKDGAWAAEQLSALPEVAKVLNAKDAEK